jgi:hypothetical protein
MEYNDLTLLNFPHFHAKIEGHHCSVPANFPELFCLSKNIFLE